MAMTTTHPLFDPNSYYRAATQDWLWYDGGMTAIRRFFEGLRKRQLLERGTPDADWGYGDEINREINEYLQLRQPPSFAPGDVTTVEAGHRFKQAAGKSDCPLYRFDIATQELTEQTQVRSIYGTEPTSETFSPNVDVASANRSCLLLLLSRTILHRLRNLLAIPSEELPALGDGSSAEFLGRLRAGDENAPMIIEDVLRETLSSSLSMPAREDFLQLRRAWWASAILGEAVGVSGISNERGRLSIDVALQRAAPTLGDIDFAEYIAVLCVGPEAEGGQS